MIIININNTIFATIMFQCHFSKETIACSMSIHFHGLNLAKQRKNNSRSCVVFHVSFLQESSAWKVKPWLRWKQLKKTAAVSERHVSVDHLTSPCALTISDDFTLFPYVCQWKICCRMTCAYCRWCFMWIVLNPICNC
jgi:hypothetical protein